jgi:hypothetical protein
MRGVEGREELAEIERWFAERGFTLAYVEREGEIWTDLVGQARTWERFGGGHGAKTELAAARSAKHRYVYQEEPPPPLPRRLP